MERAGDMMLESEGTKTGRLAAGGCLAWSLDRDGHSCQGEKAEQKWARLGGTDWLCREPAGYAGVGLRVLFVASIRYGLKCKEQENKPLARRGVPGNHTRDCLVPWHLSQVSGRFWTHFSWYTGAPPRSLHILVEERLHPSEFLKAEPRVRAFRLLAGDSVPPLPEACSDFKT